MREIKFRAWDKEVETMHKVIEMSFSEDGSIDGVLDDVCRRYFFNKRTLVDGDYIDDVVLMQYTGFNIKNEEIYEGDILQITLEDDVETLVDFGTVQMNNEGCWVVYVEGTDSEDFLWDWVTENIEIIGNIYENPELLGVAEC